MMKGSSVVGQSKNPNKRDQPDVIEISSDEEVHQYQSTDKHRSKILKVPTNSTSTGSSRHAQPVSLMQNKDERNKLESERLARQRARDQDKNSTTKPSEISNKPIERVSHLDATESFQNYWNSTIKTTFNRWHPDSPHSIRIEDLIGPKNRIKMAIVSSYVAQLAWIHSLFDRHTRIMVIKHDSEPGTFKVVERENMFLCHPPLLKTVNGKTRPGCMHIKFFLIFYDNFCRVAIPTANAVDFDYEVIENSVWIQDFRRSSSGRHSNTERRCADMSSFEKAFQNLLTLMGVPFTYRKSMDDYDFSAAAANLVVSIQGTHPQKSSYGQVGLANELKTLGLQSGPGTGRTVTLECQGSSIGSYDTRWIKDFYCCASGFSPTRTSCATQLVTDPMPPISVLFPTLDTIKKSKSGPAGGGTIFCNKATWQKSSFPAHLFSDAISKRLGVLMHVKMVLGTFATNALDEQIGPSNPIATQKIDTGTDFIRKEKIGFLYIGSHNFTPAAWGKFLERSESNHSPQVEISNWELGVVLPLSSNSELEQYVPWQRPPKKYGHNGRDSKIPWMQFSHGRQSN